jgi:uncharacterized protein (DUF1015 family)
VLVGPFSGQVVRPSWAARVVSPLHDVLTVEQRRAIMADDPDSYLWVTSDPQDLPDPPGGDPAAANAVAQQRLLARGAYGPALTDAAYVYRMTEDDEAHTGVVVQVSVAGFADERVMGHEGVQPERVDGLVRHFDAVPRRSELVSLLHRDDAEVAGLIAAVGRAAPILDSTDVSAVGQTVWRAGPVESARLVERLDRLPLYIADGHHRVAAAVRRWERDGRPGDATVLCVVYPEQQIRLYAFHRLVHGPVDAPALLDAVAGDFDVRPATGPTLRAGRFGLYADGRWSELVPRSPSRAPGVAGLDVSVLADLVLTPVLGVKAGDPRVEFVPELRDLEASRHACDADGGVLFTMHAPSVDDLVTVADRGEVMSAKSTYVQPKPRTGIFLH